MIILSRILLALGGLLFLVVGGGLWFNTIEAASDLGLLEVAALGKGTIRADIGGFFIGGAILQLLAAVQMKPGLLWPVQLLILLAFTGRCLTLVLDGPVAAGVPSMAIELILLGLIAWCKRLWASAPA